MMTFPLTVSSPNGTLFSGEVVSVMLRGSEGDLAILAEHVPFITAVKPCVCHIDLEDGTSRRANIGEEGLLTVSETAATLLAGKFEWEEER